MMTKVCIVDGCAGKYLARGYCGKHYARWSKTGSTDLRKPTAACSITGCPRPPRSTYAEYCEVHYYRLRRTGSTADPVRAPEVCGVDGCLKPGATKSGLCRMHRLRELNRGDLHFEYKGPNNQRWSGDEATYTAIHQRLRIQFGRAATKRCVDCSGRAKHWSYNHTGIKEKVDETCGPYSTDLGQYSPRCVSCHKRFDLARLGKRGAA